jgi:DNA mismatch endonuclease (patch repair protein)
MKSVRRSGTKPEVSLQEALHGNGLKYQVDARPLPNSTRKADILFPTELIAVFVDGCFWHGCPFHGTQAKANAEFWLAKIKANKRRDRDTNRKLKKKRVVGITRMGA